MSLGPRYRESLSLTLIFCVASDYDQYYASLAASTAPSAQATPITTDGASDLGEEEEEAKPSPAYLTSLNEYRKRSRSREDIDGGSATPKMQKLNGHAHKAMNGNGNGNALASPVGPASASASASVNPKPAMQIERLVETAMAAALTTNGVHAAEVVEEMVVVAADSASDSGPVVYGGCCATGRVDGIDGRVLVLVAVNGRPVALSAITEDHQEQMSPEEYEAYYNVLATQS